MKTLGLLIFGTLLLAGCSTTPDPELEATTNKLNSDVTDLERQNLGLKEHARRADAENARMREQIAALGNENEALKKQLAATTPAPSIAPRVAAPPKTAPAAPVDAQPAAAPQAKEGTNQDKDLLITQAQEQIADLEARIKEVRPNLALANKRVTEVIRSSVDRGAEVPPGGFIQTDRVTGKPWVYRKVLVCGQPIVLRSPSGHTHTHNESCYRTQPVGPAVIPGDFRTAYDRSAAIQAAEAAASPLKVQMTQLNSDLEKAKKELGRLRTPEKPK